MSKVATFKAKYLKDGHLSIPKGVVDSLLLRRGEEVRVVIEKEKFDKKGFLSLFGIWRDKSEEEIHLYREIVKERERFGRGEGNICQQKIR
jgi:bifunctional DNA-binding transcriptional regulator/antitoxin component of YhaV-PrlF toxin-antitoxin module